MKILVFLNSLHIGGAEWNSIELNAMLRDAYGHDIVLFGTPGSMVEVAKAKGLRFLPAPYPRVHPSIARMRALCAAVRRERPDLMQVWDYRAGLDAYYSAHLLMRIPMHLAHSGMEIDRLLPKAAPTTFMTPALVDRARATGRDPVELLLPPVDVQLNAPGVVDPRPFREKYGLTSDEVTLVTVSRLASWMKAESLHRTIDAVRALGRELPLRLVIVGDGDARVRLQEAAAEANAELGRDAVVLTGALLDPRPAYAAADIVVGMGGSSLRGMAFGKPVIVVGENGFSAPFTPETAHSFYYNGMYGVGNGAAGDVSLIADIRGLIEQRHRLSFLGEFSRQFVLRHFSLNVVSAKLAEFSERAVAESPRVTTSVADGCRTAALILGRRFVPDLVRRQVNRTELEKQRRFVEQV